MKQCIFMLLLLGIVNLLVAQVQPGLNVAENQTVIFGKDTTSVGLKLLWQPSKGAFRVGNMTSAWNYSTLGNTSVAFGTDTEASGKYSFAIGRGTLADSHVESSFGQYSLSGGSPTVWKLADPLFEVGNGIDSANRANAFTIYKNGNAEFQRSIKLGDHMGTALSDGTIRYTGADFQGRISGEWKSLITGGGSGGSSPWETQGSDIYYSNGKVGIGTAVPTDDLTIFGNNAPSEEVGLSLRNGYTASLPGFPPVPIYSIGRVWQTDTRLNIGLVDGLSLLSFYETGIDLFSPTINTKWGFNFQHKENSWTGDNKVQTWLKKAWRSDLGDYLYLGSTGNRAINNQHAMVLTQAKGIQFGKANTVDGDGLGPDIIQMTMGTTNTLQSTSPLNIYAVNDVVSFYRNGETGGVTIGGNDLPAGFRLAVDGRIATEEVLVQLSGSWPDYVFAEDYKLMNLFQLEKFINKHDHLPGIPTAEDIEAKGIELGDMQKMQMEKIEELTLYVIELQKEISKLKTKIESL